MGSDEGYWLPAYQWVSTPVGVSADGGCVGNMTHPLTTGKESPWVQHSSGIGSLELKSVESS
ncbi:MAG: hypothetical protein ABR962_00725 [Candidatus Bathyarchaeia archaeon]